MKVQEEKTMLQLLIERDEAIARQLEVAIAIVTIHITVKD